MAKPRHWTCQGCGTKNQRIKQRCPICARKRPTQEPQRQDSLADQMNDLQHLAVREGMYDAADWIKRTWR